MNGTVSAVTGACARLLHPQRLRSIREFLARPAEAISAPCRISHLALVHDENETARVEAGGGRWPSLENLCELFPERSEVLRRGPGFFRAHLGGGLWCRWELYDSFHTYTFLTETSDTIGPHSAFEQTALELVPASWLVQLPEDTLVAATHLELLPRTPEAATPGVAVLERPETEALLAPFSARRVFGSTAHAGAAWAFTDFAAHADGFTRLLVLDDRLPADALAEGLPLLGGVPVHSGPGRLVHQLLALETFRCLALIGEPFAGHVSRRVAELRRQHLRLMRRAGDGLSRSSAGSTARAPEALGPRAALDELGRLHLVLEELIAKYQPRLERSHVWVEHTRLLLRSLEEGHIRGFQPLGEVARSRLEGLERDRRSVERGTRELSERLRRSGELLRSQVTVVQMEAQHSTALKVQRMTVVGVVLSVLLGIRELGDLWSWAHGSVSGDVQGHAAPQGECT